jgi:geranyl-CoA carboxylase alpha subunit
VILERALESPRHIEIQVFADRHGQALHLGERDCSVQRRHQKLIEEAPSPAVGAALRAAMGATAVAAVRAIGYEGAGTLEFLLDAQEIGFQGHAIEVRLCAEDAPRGFMPCSGTVQRWQAPPGLRVEHALCDGAAVPPHYDSMIAKLVAHGSTREDARRRLLRGLHELVALGLPTNQAFLARCLSHPVFAAGGATTDFIARHPHDLLRTDEAAQQRVLLLAAWLLRTTQGADPVGHGPHAGGQRSAPAPTLTHGLPVGLRLALNGEDHALRLTERAPGRFELALADAVHELQAVAVDAHQARCIIDGVMQRVVFHRDGAQLWLAQDGQAHAVEDRTYAPAARQGPAGGDGRVRAAMNGRVVALLVAPGEAVQAGQPVLTLEAMKMEHVHHAGVAGVVAALHATAGEQVAAGRVVVEISPASPPRP